MARIHSHTKSYAKSFVYRLELPESSHFFDPVTKQRIGELQYAYCAKNKDKLAVYYIDRSGCRVMEDFALWVDLPNCSEETTLTDAFEKAIKGGLKPIASFRDAQGAFDYAPYKRGNANVILPYKPEFSDENSIVNHEETENVQIDYSIEPLFPTDGLEASRFQKRNNSEIVIAELQDALGDQFENAFGFDYDPDCAYCLRGVTHSVADHENSVSRAYYASIPASER